ncbi:MAG: dTDP-4-dehydrorhamnose reductase [Bacteroidota bacterium]
MNILVTGSNGQLGSDMRDISGTYTNDTFHFTDVAELDITNRAAIHKFMTLHNIQCIINSAAYTAVDKAESEPEAAYQINKTAVQYLAEAALTHNALMVQVSTDYVFDGNSNRPYTERDEVNPQSVYGASKLAGEQVMIASGVNGIIVRTSWLYSSYGNNFVKTMMRLAGEKGSLRVIADQSGTPTYSRDLAKAILDIIPQIKDTDRAEIFHYSNAGETNWYEFAVAITSMAGIPCTVNPITTSDYPTAAKRPQNSILSKQKISERFGISLPQWKDSLSDCIQKLLTPQF